VGKLKHKAIKQNKKDMKKAILILITLILAINLSAQIQKDINNILLKKDINTFNKYTDSISKKDKRIKSHWEYLRELKPIPDKDNPCTSFTNMYRLTVLLTDNEIIYYNISEAKRDMENGNFAAPNPSIYKYKNDTAYTNLKTSFKKTYGANLNEKELFREDIVYGGACGIVGTPPKKKTEIDYIVKNRNRTDLFKWLQSTNTETQIYAINGYYQLKELGIKLTAQELRIIKIVMNKKGSILSCGGCMYSNEEISSAVKEFKF